MAGKPKDAGKGSSTGRRRIASYVDEPVWRRLKVYSAATDKPMWTVIEEAINDYLDAHHVDVKLGKSGQ